MGQTKIRGDATEIGCILAFTKIGWKVSIPYGEDSNYDLIVDTGNELMRVQCKSCKLNPDNSSIHFHCTSRNKAYPLGSIDYFATIYKDKCYLIPFTGLKSVSLRLIPPKNNQKKLVKFAHDYFVGSIL